MNQEKAREEFHVGNLYFNRGCTGAQSLDTNHSVDSTCQVQIQKLADLITCFYSRKRSLFLKNYNNDMQRSHPFKGGFSFFSSGLV